MLKGFCRYCQIATRNIFIAIYWTYTLIGHFITSFPNCLLPIFNWFVHFLVVTTKCKPFIISYANMSQMPYLISQCYDSILPLFFKSYCNFDKIFFCFWFMVWPYAYKDLSSPLFPSDLHIKLDVWAIVDCLLF